MLKRFAAKSAGETETSELYEVNGIEINMERVLAVPADNECAIVTTEIQNIGDIANIVLQVRRNAEIISMLLFEITEWNNLILDSKEFLEEYDEVWFGSDVEGVMLSISCDISEVEGAASGAANEQISEEPSSVEDTEDSTEEESN